MVEELTFEQITQNRIDRFTQWAEEGGVIGLQNIEFVNKERALGLSLTKDIQHRESSTLGLKICLLPLSDCLADIFYQ